MDVEQRRRRKHGMLKMYYGLDDNEGKEMTSDPVDIDGAHFDPDVYLARLMREKRLNELVDREVDMVKRKFKLRFECFSGRTLININCDDSM